MVSDLAARLDRAAEVFSRRRRLEQMLTFEASLARALARVDSTTREIVEAIVAQCDATLYDADQLAHDAVGAGNEAIPLVERLRARVAQANADAAPLVHCGATSQDVIDTALMLQLREGLALYDAELRRLMFALADLAVAESETVMVARTWLQHALPTTFGFKVATWLDGVHRAARRIRDCRSVLAVQFGGAVGTLAALGHDGPAIAAALASELGLPMAAAPWHTTRDRVAEIAGAIGVLTGTLGKIARDIALHAQSEIDELREPAIAGRGRSSTMPHKRNPVGCASILAAAVRMPGLVSTILAGMVQEHERALGGWQAEWETMPEIGRLGLEALAHTTQIVSGLEVDRARMASNLEATRGAVFSEAVSFALAAHVGGEAKTHVRRALRRATSENRHLRDVLKDDREIGAHLSKSDVDRLFDPRNYLGVAPEVTRRVVERARAFAGEGQRGAGR